MTRVTLPVSPAKASDDQAKIQMRELFKRFLEDFNDDKWETGRKG